MAADRRDLHSLLASIACPPACENIVSAQAVLSTASLRATPAQQKDSEPREPADLRRRGLTQLAVGREAAPSARTEIPVSTAEPPTCALLDRPARASTVLPRRNNICELLVEGGLRWGWAGRGRTRSAGRAPRSPRWCEGHRRCPRGWVGARSCRPGGPTAAGCRGAARPARVNSNSR
jgi:hypothetical protein